MHGILSLTALAGVVATASCSIVPILEDSVRAVLSHAPEAPAAPGPLTNELFVPPWLLELLVSGTIPATSSSEAITPDPTTTPTEETSSSTSTLTSTTTSSSSTQVPDTASSISSTTSKPTAPPIPSPGVQAPATKTCPSTTKQSAGTYWLDEQDHTEAGAGYAPYAAAPKSTLYIIQKAIEDDGNGGSRKGQGVTRYPAEIFLPAGVYQLESTLYLTVGTIIVGDPQNPPIIRAGPNFNGQFLVMGYDQSSGHPETSFMTLVKNVILDTTGASGLTNVEIRMPTNSKTHTGIDINAGSTIAITDVTITGGATGIINSNQQVNFKNVYFRSCGTAFDAKGGWTVLLQGATFESCSGPVVNFHDSSHDNGYQNSQLLIQNLNHDTNNPIAVGSDGQVHLAATNHVDTWLWGSLVEGSYETGATHSTQRSAALLANDKFFTKKQPTYAEHSKEDIVNVKAVPGFTVKGDGQTDDTAALNAILLQNANNCKITYIPYGVYRVSDTILIPVGSRIVGEAWSVISGFGPNFKDENSPKPVVRVGNPGDVGVIEIQDMRFSVAEILPGAKIIEVNAAGSQPGDVGLWNTMALVGGTADTSISTKCTSQDTKNCMAAFMVMHLTATSSAYIENFWGWTADHNLDGGSALTVISTGRGILVEATKGTWLTGTGSEHHWLYNYNFNRASNVYAGLLQTETPYMQGTGESEMAPAPWTAEAALGDPDFTWCGPSDAKCRTSLATNIQGGSDIALYNSAAWAFFDGEWNGLYNEPCEGKCQSNMMRVAGNPQNLVWYSISTRETDVMVLDDKSNPREADHPGGWEGIIQVYGEFSA
ncbi:CAZyme family GH55 [Penicillium chermesinum]|nr:CAZyme family GH55 [Penicillium chermesinum]